MEKSHHIKNVQDCTDTSDCIEVSRTSGLYLKPVARLSITVTLPQLKSGQSISNWEVMEKLRAAILPEVFSVIQITKSTLEFLRFDAEIENKKNLSQVISKIDQKGIKLSGFSELLKIRATEAKVPFPSRHDWDCFFRDAKHMNEMKPGERPDTVHFQDLPCRWFTHVSDENRNEPSEYVLSKVMTSFGEVRVVDIPMCDPYRKKMSASINGIKTFSFGQDLLFEAYVQFKEYIGFAKCMHALQGKKLVYMENGKAYSANIKVDFDRTKHLSEYSIKKRQAERDKLQAVERELEEKLRRKQELEEMKREAERLRLEDEQRLKEERRQAKRKEKELRRKMREEKRRAKRMEKEEERIKREQEEEEARFARKIALEERKLLIAQRKLESIRLLDELFERIKVDRQKKVAQLREAELFEHVDKENTKKLKELKKKEVKEKKLQEKMALKERELRDRLVRSYKSKEEDRMELQREKVRKAVQGQVRMQSGLSIKSLSSISSATSESGSDISSDTESDSDSSLKPTDSKVMIGRLRMDHMEEDYGDIKWQAQNTQDQQNYYPPCHDAYGFKEGHGYPEEWGYNEGYDRGRGRGRGRWRFPRGPWRGRGFRDRGRGFRDRGRGFRGSWHGNSTGYDESKKPLEMRKPKTTWYKRGEDTGGESPRSRSRSRLRSYSRSRRSRSGSRSRSRSRRTRSKSRSRSRRTRSRSKSRSRKSRSRSSSRSRSRSRKSSQSKSRSNRSSSKSRSKSKRSRSRSRSNHAKSHSKSRSRSRRRSRTRSRSKTRSRSHSKSRRRRRSDSEEHSSHSDGRRRDKHRSERHQYASRKKSDDRYDFENLRESDLELSSDPEGQYDHDHYPDDECDEEGFHSKDFYSRGSGWRGRQNFIRGPRGRWPRNWNRRGRGWGYSNYPDYHEYDKWKPEDVNSGEQYREMYQKYFESLADREAAEKRKEDNIRSEEERSYPDLKENEEYRPRERETSRRDLPLDRNHPPEEPLRGRSSRIHERLRESRKMEENDMLDNFSGETEIRKQESSRNYPARDNKKEKLGTRDFELKDVRRGTSRESDWLDHNRHGNLHENVGHTVGHQGKDRYEEKRYSDADRRSYERKHEGGSGYSDKDNAIDVRWKSSVMRADIENMKSDKKEVSVKDRLSFAPVKREPGISHSKYDPGYDYERNHVKTHPDRDRFSVRSKVQSGRDRANERQDTDASRGRRDQRLVEVTASRDLPPRELREKVNVGHSDRRSEGRSESKSKHTFELHDSPISSESDSISNDGKDSYAKEYGDRKRKPKESDESDSDSDDDDDDDDSHYKRHQKKRRKNSKKKKEEKKHKYKKKKKKKDGRRE